MKNILIAAFTACCFINAVCLRKPLLKADAFPVTSDLKKTEDPVKRGEYLVMVMGCADCHAPKKMGANGPEPNMNRFLSGYNSTVPLETFDKDIIRSGQWVVFNNQSTAFFGPWGASFAANLTPDETGIGTWSYQQFETAMRKGKFKGLESGRSLMPPMPWQNYVLMKNEDMRAVFAYLKSLKPVSNVVPAYIPPGR